MKNVQLGTTILRLIVFSIVFYSGLVAGSGQLIAQSLGDFFSFTYQAQLSETEISKGETFFALIKSEVIYKGNLPISPRGARITSRIVARRELDNNEAGNDIILNPGYTLNVNPFPRRGEQIELSSTVPLQFPPESEPGAYQVVGVLESARLIIGPISISATRYLPQLQVLGKVSYTGLQEEH
ncbi:MAG TPA: hypothetical protein PK016_07050 [Candidatus Atribacteria bacterium]|nr:hypothetical protein [Candidatus Atribacteria bacterium]